MTQRPNDGVIQQEIGWDIAYAHGQGHDNFVPELRGANGLLRLNKMAETDETIGAMLWVITSTLCQMPWSFVPCLNGMELSQADEEYEAASQHADFAQSCLTDMEHSWEDHIEEAITMTWAGFAPCEINFKPRDGDQSKYDDGLWGFRSLPLRDQHTIWDWEQDDRNHVTAMVQRTLTGQTAVIPVWKLLHYRMSRVLNNPWGISMLTNAWRPFYLKQRIQESEAIGIDREMAGMPTMRVPSSEIALSQKKDSSGKLTPEAVAAQRRIQDSIKAVTSMRFNEVGGLLLPSDVFEDEDGKPGTVRKWDFSIITSAGQRSIDPRTAARDYDRAIARVAMMQFLHLGDRSGGSHGLSADQSDMAQKSMRWLAQKIEGEMNIKAVPLLWMLNAMPKQYMPRLRAGNPTQESMDVLGQFLGHLADADILFADDPALKDTVLDRVGLRSPRRVFRDVAPKPRPLEGPPGAQPDVAAPAAPPPDGKAPPAKQAPAGGKAGAQRVRKPSS